MHLNDSIRQFLSALAGGVASVTVCHPLDVARTMMNIMAQSHDQNQYRTFFGTLQTIYREEGWRGFYKGYRTTIISIPLFNCIYFPIYGHVKKRLRLQHGYGKTTSALGASFVGGLITNIISNPLWVVRTRVMVQILRPHHERYKQTSALQVLNRIVKEEGVSALFRGLSASLVGMLHACVYFPIYEELKTYFNPDQKKLKSHQIFICAIISKCKKNPINIVVACLATYPHIVIRTIMHDHRNVNRLKITQVIRNIFRQHGIKGFYLGLKPDLIRVIPSNAITFVVYELVKRNL